MSKIFINFTILVVCLCFLTQPNSTNNTVGVNVKNFGAIGDGKTDDTAAIQNVLKKYDAVYIPDGVYLINADEYLRVKSNQIITLSDDAVLQAMPSSKGYYNIFLISNVHNVIITGGSILGDRNNHLGTEGEWGSGINIVNGSSNITVKNITIKDCWGDAIHVGDNSISKDIYIDKVNCDNNRRHGLSICWVDNITVSNSIFSNSNGTAPQSGIDIEPNAGTSTTNINLSNIKCFGNAGRGLSLSGFNGTLSDVYVTNSLLYNNNGAGFFIETVKDLTVSETYSYNNVYGITILKDTENAMFDFVMSGYNNKAGLEIYGCVQTSGIEDIVFTNSNFFNNSQEKSNKCDGALIASDNSGYIKDITFIGCKFYDEQVQPTQRYGIRVNTSAMIQNIVVTGGSTFSKNISGNCSGSVTIQRLMNQNT